MSDANSTDKRPATTIVNCPTCAKPVEWNEDSKWRPFCSNRCKLIDLGEWASESYSLHGKGENDFRTKPNDED